MAIRRASPRARPLARGAESHVHPIVRALGGTAVVGGRASSDADVMAQVATGLPVAAFDALISRYRLRRDAVATVIGLPGRTLARRQSSGRLSPQESDRLARVARILVHAEDALDGPENAGSWLQHANRALEGLTPLASLTSDIGAVRVNDILHRIEYGMVS